MEIFQQPPVNPEYLFSAMVGMPRRAVPARVVAGGTNIRATLAIEGVAPLHAARTSQHDVPTTLNTYTRCISFGTAPGAKAARLPSLDRCAVNDFSAKKSVLRLDW